MQNFLFSVLKRGIGATDREQSLDLVEGSLLIGGAGFGVKGVALIPFSEIWVDSILRLGSLR
jgi:hypothetical protein